MKNEKEQITTIDTLPDDAELDTIYTEYLYSELEKSLDDLKNGRFMTLEESEERMRRKHENYNIK